MTGMEWSPGDPPERFLGTLSMAYGPDDGRADRPRDDVAERVSALILGARHPERLLPGREDGKPVFAPPYGIDDPWDGGSRLLGYYHVDPTGLDPLGGPIVRAPEGLYINPVYMYRDMLDMTEDPEGSLSVMGFGRALRLSSLSRYRIGRLRDCTGSSRRALFDVAVSHAAQGDLDWVLEIVARTAGMHVPDLGSILGMYKGLPVGFILEDLAVCGR